MVYKCRSCGNVVKLLAMGGGELACCGRPLTFLGRGWADDSRPKGEPPIDLIEVMDGGKSRWEFPKSGERRPGGEGPQAWDGDSGGLSAGDFFAPAQC